ncbi:hypothetical protein M514_06093 [Trichuris suis]|uniref:Uncharacterized protein n=1 Tax=Trichuris suis TaxID=68888 RepID=A0A085M6Y1_9BILA|nr:hypothetical protein M513_06093 [Trichuris suis]KFD69894.1 hypothetical protein M514_06093 [Trichuris suis]
MASASREWYGMIASSGRSPFRQCSNRNFEYRPDASHLWRELVMRKAADNEQGEQRQHNSRLGCTHNEICLLGRGDG